jgi:phosphoserine phosphatase
MMRIAAFDLDGTLLRGQTACEAIAMGIGRIGRMREFEELGSSQIEEMAEWYSSFTFSDLCKHLTAIRVAPGVDEGFALLHDHGFKIAIVSLTWEFAVEWFANRLGADYSVGTGLSSGGLITHFWPQDKALWLTGLAAKLGVDMKDVAAVGDSGGDIPMLLSVGHRFWVGETILPQLEGKVIHEPTGDMRLVAHRIIEAQR